MILRRVAAALIRQDWATVTIEFLIVVAGIFFGLQANDWARDRQDRADERAALDRLFVEMRHTNQELDILINRNRRLNVMRRASIQFVDSDQPVPENDLPLKIGINTLAQFPPVLPVSAVYEELKSSGQLRLIQNPDLRMQLAEFHTGLDWLNKIRDGFRDGTDVFWGSYQRHIRWNYNPESTTSDILLSSYDWEGLRADEQFKFLIIGLLRNHLVGDSALVDLQTRAVTACRSLGQAVGKECVLTGQETTTP